MELYCILFMEVVTNYVLNFIGLHIHREKNQLYPILVKKKKRIGSRGRSPGNLILEGGKFASPILSFLACSDVSVTGLFL